MGKLIVTNTSVLLPDMTIARGRPSKQRTGSFLPSVRIRKEKK